MVLAFGVVIMAVVLVRMDLRQQRNNRFRMLCAEYWGAADGGDREQRAWEKTKQLVGCLSWICSVSAVSTAISSAAWLSQS